MQTIQLMGAEQVQNAANTFRSAADQMQRSANQMNETLTRHREFLDDWLNRLEAILKENLDR